MNGDPILPNERIGQVFRLTIDLKNRKSPDYQDIFSWNCFQPNVDGLALPVKGLRRKILGKIDCGRPKDPEKGASLEVPAALTFTLVRGFRQRL